MRALFDIAPGGNRGLLVMLPAAKARPEDFVEHGFIRAVRERELPLDVAAVDAHSDLYLDGNIVERLESEVIEPMRARGYTEICLLGISLGGMGSIAYACRHGHGISKVILLAPFLGVRGPNGEPELLGALGAAPLPEIFLGYGKRDRYARTSELLARHLPGARVTIVEGGHDWSTWSELWRIMLAQAFAQ
jgi:predicted esterase